MIPWIEENNADVAYLLIRIIVIIALIMGECARGLYCRENKC
jgi:hypothetical protein